MLLALLLTALVDDPAAGVPAAGTAPEADVSRTDEAPPSPPAAPAVVSAPERKLLQRIMVQGTTLADVDERVGRFFETLLLAELRKLRGASVISMDEIRAVVDLEAAKQLAGCDDACLSEIADAVSADLIVTAEIAHIGGAHAVTLRRIDTRLASAPRSASRRVADATGEDLLQAIGPMVAELFDDYPLQAGAERGVNPAVVARLHPPPLPPAVLFATAAAGGVAVAAGAVAAAASAISGDSARQQLQTSLTVPVSGREVVRAQEQEATYAAFAAGLFASGAALFLACALEAPFTDFVGANQP